MAAEMFGPYRLDELIGRGGMGEVYRAFDTVHERTVAVKRLPVVLAADPDFRTRFAAEAAMAARLNEPHIIPIHDFGEIDGRLYIDMRLVDGRDLATELATRGRLSPERARRIVGQLAAALDVAHAAGMVHRDIKPSNVLLTADPAGTAEGEFVYLADFGIAQALSEASTAVTNSATTVGSLEYMAPERFTGGHADRRADVYALGCLLFEALTARKPFVVQGLPALMHAHLMLPPPRPSDVLPGLPSGLDAVVARAMAKDPAQRYPTAGDLATAVRAALDGSGPHTGGEAGAPSTPGVVAAVGPATPGYLAVPVELGGQQQPPPVPAADHIAGRRRRVGLIVASALAVVLVVISGATLALALNRRADPAEVSREPIRTGGVNPFMPPVGQDRSGVTGPQHVGGNFPGNTPGLYGGTLNQAACDPEAMVRFLQTHPEKAAAWAGVEGIAVSEIPSYVARLTPVVLRSDTAVTNHGFAGGRATVIRAVLQAGTGVLIDEYGVPRAKCYCGNPLTPPATVTRPRYVGGTWSDFTPDQVTIVQPAPSAVNEFTLVDPSTSQPFRRPVGTRGGSDVAATQQTSSATSSTTDSASLQPSTESVPAVQPTQPPVVTRTEIHTAPPAPPPTTVHPQTHAPQITGVGSYREDALVYFRITYADQDGDAEGFGFRGVNGSGWGQESHPFTSPSYGRWSPGRIDYPFNLACGQPNQYETDVQAWIYDSTGLESTGVVIHLKCG
jgi:hypothetical protein